MELTPDYAARGVNKLALMAFFPSDPEVRGALVEIVMQMVETQEQFDWLVARTLKLHSRWPGVAELRAVYSSRWKPADGIEGWSEVYPDGIPSERPAPPPPSPLPRGHKVTKDSDFDAKIQAVAKTKAIPKARRK